MLSRAKPPWVSKFKLIASPHLTAISPTRLQYQQSPDALKPEKVNFDGLPGGILLKIVSKLPYRDEGTFVSFCRNGLASSKIPTEGPF
jgi:hypothetical protein